MTGIDWAPREVLTDRINKAAALARDYGGIDGDHHKAWVLNQMVEELTGGSQSLPQKGIAP